MIEEAQENEVLRVSVGSDNKYTVIQEKGGKLHALRYGEPWRDCVGDGMILAMAYEIERLRTQVATAKEIIDSYEK